MSHNEKWERKKRYLQRNLLENPGYRLSPVTEESVSDDLVSGPYSPLPDLVIEPEPNRHDDPPEFYQGLEVRMRRLYKRLMEDRESSEDTEGLSNIEKDISGSNVDQHMSESDPEIFNTNKDKSAKCISPVVGLGQTTTENKTTKMDFTESNFDYSHFISTANDKSTERASLGSKCDDSETKNEQLESHLRSSPIISYGRTMLDLENKSNETELTELDIDLSNVISTTENESKLISIENKDGQSKLDFEKQSTVDFGSKTFSVNRNKTTETELTESDENYTHVITTTIAEIHEEPLSGKSVIIETESPVLVPKPRKINITGVISGFTRNNILDDNAEDKNNSKTLPDVEMTNENKNRDTIIDHTDRIPDREVENILQKAEAVTLDRVSEINKERSEEEKSKESSEDSEELFAFLKGSNADTEAGSATEGSFASDKSSSQGRKRLRNADELVSDKDFEMALRKEAFDRINRRKTFDHSSEVQSETEEINDSKEYFIQQITNDVDSDIDSFEIAMCRENFQRINRRKGFGHSSEESHSVTEEEAVEVMRGAPRSDPVQALRRRSTASQDSLLGTFAKPFAAEIHEDEGLNTSRIGLEVLADRYLSEESTETKSPVLGSSTTQTHKVVKFKKGTSTGNEDHTNVFPLTPLKSQSGIDNQDESKAQKRPYFYATREMSGNKPTKSFPMEVQESSVGTEEATPSAPKNVMSTLCDAIWSVSPISINAADFSPVTPNPEVLNKKEPAKRRQKFSSDVLKKRKKFQNRGVQTSPEPISWDTIRSDFFVGTPRIFNLCSCEDHTCPD